MYHLQDGKVSINSIIAILLWIVGAAFIGGGFIVRLELCAVGLFVAGVGGVLSIRGFLCELASREQNAFELGRDYQRIQESGVANVRSLP